MNTNELTGAALNWAVAKCEGYEDKDFCPHDKHFRDEDDKWFSPADDWAHAGPIIEREGISLVYDVELCQEEGQEYYATSYAVESGEGRIYGPTPLIAAMRCYVAFKLGDTVELPEGLKP